jgi:hypothetical protein
MGGKGDVAGHRPQIKYINILDILNQNVVKDGMADIPQSLYDAMRN